MNLPNKLTLMRFALTPVFMVVMLLPYNWSFFFAMLIFVAASITDYFDGKIARERNLVTDFGKFLDPIADKMLTTAAFLGFCVMKIGYGIVWVVFIVLLREFVVTSVRLAAASSGKVVAANIWGKLKTVVQMVAIIATLFFYFLANAILLPYFPELHVVLYPVIEIVCSVLLWISAVLTLVAGVTYIVDNKDFINPNK